MSLSAFIVFGFAAWLALVVLVQVRYVGRELGRFREDGGEVVGEASRYFDRVVKAFGKKFGRKQDLSLSAHASKGEQDMARKLADAGLEGAAEQGKFFLLRTLSYVLFPLVGASSYLFFIPYYGTIFTLMTSAAGIVLPMFWLKGRIIHRTEEIQRELPLVLDLTNLGTSAGWDVASSLERVIDSLYAEFPKHPLIREFKRARWLAASGYTWEEALRRAGGKLNNETVQRTTMALGQAIRLGGDRSKQLEGIAEDAQRVYYGELDKRLAGLPVKALLATMMLMIAYFIILLAPAVVQIKTSIGQAQKNKAKVEAPRNSRGSISLIEAAIVMTLALALLLTLVGFESNLSSVVRTDGCLVEQSVQGLDLAASDFDPATACPTPTPVVNDVI
jgi:pilus assembly protein TadC